jgi:hypothetical protein
MNHCVAIKLKKLSLHRIVFQFTRSVCNVLLWLSGFSLFLRRITVTVSEYNEFAVFLVIVRRMNKIVYQYEGHVFISPSSFFGIFFTLTVATAISAEKLQCMELQNL